MPSLYVVATPIGNLEDITLRAIRVLREVKLIAAEDTRKTKRLLKAYDIDTPMTSYYEHSKQSKLSYILERLDEGDVALVSEAGMPGISDPGYELITAATERGNKVVPIPGPSAIVTALAVSALPTDRFYFLGFLPHRENARRRLLESIAGETGTIVVLESPHRLAASLDNIREILGDRRLAVCRELTKLHEEIFRGTVSEAIERFKEPRGEFTLVIAGRGNRDRPVLTEDIEKQLHQLYLKGSTAKEAIAVVAGKTGLSKKVLYQAWLRLDEVWERERDSCEQSGRRR
jgi:16S rRNA (cytidine1402-2'-O)-methyltransferase